MDLPNPMAEPAAVSPANGLADIRDILEVLGVELVDLGQVGTALQATLSPQRGHDYEELQTLDLLTQRLFCMAEFLSALSPSVTPESKADLRPALATICLSDMVHRLSCASFPGGAGAPPPARVVETGALDLF